MRAILAAMLLVSTAAWGGVATNTSTKAVNLSTPAADFGDFFFTWRGYDDQQITLSVGDNSGPVSLTGDTVEFKMSRKPAGAEVTAYVEQQATVSGSNITTAVAASNVPPNGTYLAEFMAHAPTYRSIARGKIMVVDSLYDDDDGTYSPTYTNYSVDYVSSVAPGAYVSGSGSTGAITLNVTGVTATTTFNAFTNTLGDGAFIGRHDTNSYATVAQVIAATNSLGAGAFLGRHDTNGYLIGTQSNLAAQVWFETNAVLGGTIVSPKGDASAWTVVGDDSWVGGFVTVFGSGEATSPGSVVLGSGLTGDVVLRTDANVDRLTLSPGGTGNLHGTTLTNATLLQVTNALQIGTNVLSASGGALLWNGVQVAP